MSDEPSSFPDLATIDLSLSFAPAWAKESDSGARLAKLAAKHGGEERPKRAGVGGKWQDRSERRPPRREEGKRPGGGRRERKEERRPERARVEPALTGWDVQFVPDRHGVDGLARQIKTSAKAYPLFDLARLVLEKSERYLVGFKRTNEAATPLYQLKSDGSLWLSEAEAIGHAVATQLDRFYRRERIAVEPPKGAYPFVAVCGMSGVLLGPPNYHDYQTKLIRLHAERFANVPFEIFKSRIRMERDEALIEKWKDEQSARDVFYPLDASEPVGERPAEAPAPTPAPDAAMEEATPEVTETSTETIEPPAEASADSSADLPEKAEEETEAAEASTGTGPRLESLAEIERHFREHHAAGAVVRIRDRVVVPGPAALNDSAAAVLRVTRGVWEELDKFPLPLAHVLGQQLTAKGVQIFKTRENITYAGVARPRHLDVSRTPVSDALRGMLKYIEDHRAVPRAEQWKALVALRPVAEGGSETLRETAVAADLFWLLREGHVIDYAKRGLEAARPPKITAPKTAKVRPESPAAEAPVPVEAETAVVESASEETGQISVSPDLSEASRQPQQ